MADTGYTVGNGDVDELFTFIKRFVTDCNHTIRNKDIGYVIPYKSIGVNDGDQMPLQTRRNGYNFFGTDIASDSNFSTVKSVKIIAGGISRNRK